MKAILILLGIVLSGSGVARADQNSDLFDGILAEAKMPDGSALNMGRQGRASLFVATMNSLAQMRNAVIQPMTFELSDDSQMGQTRFTGVTTASYLNMPICTTVKVKVSGHFPIGDKTNRNIYVESVEMNVVSADQCV